VVAQGQPAAAAETAALRALRQPMLKAVLRLGAVAEGLRRPYKGRLEAAGGDAEAVRQQVGRGRLLDGGWVGEACRCTDP